MLTSRPVCPQSQLRYDIFVDLNRQLLQNVSFLKSMMDSPEFVKQLMAIITSEGFMPGDTIIQEGEVASGMFLVARGSVEVTSESGNLPAVVLREGSVIGEQALLNENDRRGATVTALEYCEVFRIQRSDFNDMLHGFPQLRAEIEAIGDRRRNEKKALQHAQSVFGAISKLTPRKGDQRSEDIVITNPMQTSSLSQEDSSSPAASPRMPTVEAAAVPVKSAVPATKTSWGRSTPAPAPQQPQEPQTQARLRALEVTVSKMDAKLDLLLSSLLPAGTTGKGQ